MELFADASLFRASLNITINDLQVHVRPLSTCKVVHDTSNADWDCGLKNWCRGCFKISDENVTTLNRAASAVTAYGSEVTA